VEFRASWHQSAEQTIEALAKEKASSPTVVIQAMEEAVLTASRKFRMAAKTSRPVQPENGQIELFAVKTTSRIGPTRR
jgi:hypothetical protein